MLPILTAVTGAGEAPLVIALEGAGHGVRVVRRCADLAELLAAAGTGTARAALVSADLPRLDRDAVVRLQDAGVAVVALLPGGDRAGRDRLARLGVADVLAPETTPELIVERVLAAAAELDRPRPSLADPAAALATAGSDSAVRGWLPEEEPERREPGPTGTPGRASSEASAETPAARMPGRIVAVWGPVGAPGRTSVAIGLADELARLGRDVLLVDADSYGPSVAQSLALLDEGAGLSAAVRAANQGVLDPSRLEDLALKVLPRLRVLTGIARPERWPELRPAGLDLVWRTARLVSGWTVIDCGFGLETDEELSYDSATPRRNGATLSALGAADLVLAVGVADPVGLQRFIRGWQELAQVRPAGTPVRAVLTRVRPSAVGANPGRRVGEALARYAGVVDPVLVPDDRPAYDGCLLSGRTLAEDAPNSPARSALAGLAQRVVQEFDPVAAPGGARAGRRGRP